MGKRSDPVFHLGILTTLCLSVALAAGCSQYRFQSIEGGHAALQMALQGDHIVLRVTNYSETEELHIDWNSAHLRDPRGFEAPFRVVPENGVSFIYPKGKVEYHLFPGHWYVPKDRVFDRRSGLKREVAFDRLYEDFGPYPLEVFVKICEGKSCQPCEKECPAWQTIKLTGNVVRSERWGVQ